LPCGDRRLTGGICAHGSRWVQRPGSAVTAQGFQVAKATPGSTGRLLEPDGVRRPVLCPAGS